MRIFYKWYEKLINSLIYNCEINLYANSIIYSRDKMKGFQVYTLKLMTKMSDRCILASGGKYVLRALQNMSEHMTILSRQLNLNLLNFCKPSLPSIPLLHGQLFQQNQIQDRFTLLSFVPSSDPKHLYISYLK